MNKPDRSNLAARAGRWSAAHWKTAFFGWLAFVVAAVAIGMSVGTHTLSMSEQASGETARAEQILASAGFKTPAAESVLVKSAALTAHFSSLLGEADSLTWDFDVASLYSQRQQV